MFTKITKAIFLIAIIFSLSASDIFAQFGINNTVNSFPASIDKTSPIFRDGSVGIGESNPDPTNVKLYVRGRFAQEFSGTLGGNSASDSWASLGQSFIPSNATIPSIYGLINQSGATGFISGVKNKQQGVVAWSGTNARLDFDWIDSNFANQTKMSILSNGNVGIGTTNPTHNLDIRGTTRTQYLYPGIVDNNNNYSYIRFGDPSQFWAGFMYNGLPGGFGDGNDFTIFTYGNRDIYIKPGNGKTVISPNAASRVGIGTSSPQHKLDVNGDVSSTLGYYTTSDKRFKKDVKKLEAPMQKINQLEGVTYKFKKQKFGEIDFENTKDRKEYGFLAQDLEKVFPELVRQGEDGYYSVRYEGLIPVLVEAMKDQDDIIEEQANENAEQNALIAEQSKLIEEQAQEITDLNERMNRLEALLTNSNAAKQSNAPLNDDIKIANTALLKQNVPNPSSTKTTIEYELPINISNASLVVYDLNGKEIQSQFITGKGVVELDISSLTEGSYIYAIVSNGQSIARQKMIVQK